MYTGNRLGHDEDPGMLVEAGANHLCFGDEVVDYRCREFGPELGLL